jgi:uncharacterized protein
MTINLHAAATQTFLVALAGLSQVLKKGEANAIARKIDPSVFLNARLAPDMFHLIRQVQIATDTVKGAVHRLAELEIPKFEDNETDICRSAGAHCKDHRIGEKHPGGFDQRP